MLGTANAQMENAKGFFAIRLHDEYGAKELTKDDYFVQANNAISRT